MHESSENRQNEKRIGGYFAQTWKVESSEAPRLCPVDGAFFRDGNPVAYYEAKKRNYQLSKLPSVWLDKHKIDKAFAVAESMGMRFLLLFEFDDGMRYCVVKNTASWRTEKNRGPRQERDGFDRDEVYCIPVSEWSCAGCRKAFPDCGCV